MSDGAMPVTERERERFETFMRGRGWEDGDFAPDDNGDYKWPRMNWAWIGWQGQAAAAGVPREALEQLPEYDTTRPRAKQGLYRKFNVTRVDGTSAPGGKHDGCSYFVLDRTHDKHARAALLAYADSCESEYPELAADLRRDYAAVPREDARVGLDADALKRRISKIMREALGGRVERYRFKEDEDDYIRWGLVEDDIASAIDAAIANREGK